MADIPKIPNTKLFEDLEFTKKLVNDQKKLDKKNVEDPRSLTPEKIENSRNDNQRKNFTSKRFKTPWEAGKRNPPNEHRRQKSPSYNTFRRNENRDFEDSQESKIPYKSRKDTYYNDDNEYGENHIRMPKKPWTSNSNETRNKKWENDSKNNNYKSEKHVKWKGDIHHKTRESGEKYQYENNKSGRDSNNFKENQKFKKGDKPEFLKKNPKWDEEYNSGESDYDRKNHINKDREGKRFKEGWYEKSSTPKHWPWGKKDQSQGKRDQSWGKRDLSRGKRDQSWGKRDHSWGKRDQSRGKRDQSWGKRDLSRGKRDQSWGERDHSWGKRDQSRGKRDQSWGKRDQTQEKRDQSWGKRDRSRSENQNTSYKERDLDNNKYKGNNNLNTYDSEQQEDFEGYKNRENQNDQNATYNSRYPKRTDKEDRKKSSSREIRPMQMVKRHEWGAPKTKWGIGPPLKLPVKHIFCLPTEKNRCFNLKQCTKELLYLHERHTCTPTCPDIKFSFFIGTNGTVYECRGWRTRPGLPKKFENINKSSLFIAFAGKYNKYNIPDKMINARDYVIDYGLKHALIDKDYIIRSAVDHSNMSSSEGDKDEEDDRDTQDQSTEYQDTNDQGTEDQDTHDRDAEDQDTNDQGTEDQDTNDQETEDEDTLGQETEDQDTHEKENDDLGSDDQEDEDQENSDEENEDKNNDHGEEDNLEDFQLKDEFKDLSEIDSSWQDEFNKDNSISCSSVKSWESYSSSWDISEGELERQGLLVKDDVD